MANKRMFSLDVVNTDLFLDMPVSAQNLYFHLGMRADDDGFVASPRQVMKLVNCTKDDMRILVSKGYVIPFETGIIVICHWKQNNYIRSDRYRQTKYIAEKQQLQESNGIYSLSDFGIPHDNQPGDNRYTEVRVDKSRLDNNITSNVILSEAETAPNHNTASDSSGILLSPVDKTDYDVPLSKIAEWREAYPAVDIEQELKKMVAWLNANPSRKKTRRGINRFINIWLSREQDKGGRYKNGNGQQIVKSQTKPTGFTNFKQRDYDFDELERQLLDSQKGNVT